MDTLFPRRHQYPFLGQLKWIRPMSGGRPGRGAFPLVEYLSAIFDDG